MKTSVLAFVIVLLSMCVSSACTDPLDPTGNWNAALTWTTGSCRLTGVLPVSMNVAHGPTGLVITGSEGRNVQGSVVCSPAQCQLSFFESGPGQGDVTSLELRADLTLNEADQIMGSGQIHMILKGGTTCSKSFLATGRMNEGVVISP